MNNLIEKIKKAADQHQFWGTVSVIKGDDQILDLSFGPRDLSNQLPNHSDTKYGLASGTKSFTAVAIGTLIDQGKLTLKTTMMEIFGEEYPFIHPEATIKQLLEHTSGIFDYYDEETVEDFDNYRVEIPWCLLETPSDYWPLFCDKPMKFTPGERFSYSNGGFILLGLIIERISGMVYRDYMKHYVLNPAGMENSGFFAFDDLPTNTALGYIDREGVWKSNIYNLPIRGGSDGGMYSTAADIRTFWKALLQGRILKEDTLQGFLKTQSNINEWCDYSFGFYLPGPHFGQSLMMEGCDAGVGFKSMYLIEEDLTFTVLSNKTEGEEHIFPILEKELK